MKKISSLVITTAFSFFLYFSLFCSFPVSSASYFFLTANNSKKKKKVSQYRKINNRRFVKSKENGKENSNQKKKKKKKVSQHISQYRKINDRRFVKSKESGKENSNQKYSSQDKDKDEDRLFLFLIIVFLVIFIFFFLYISFSKNRDKEKDKKTEVDQDVNQLIPIFWVNLNHPDLFHGYSDFNSFKTSVENDKIKLLTTLNFFNYDGLLFGLSDLEITNNFLNFALEESFKRSSGDVDSKGLNFTEIIEKLQEEKIKVNFFYTSKEFSEYSRNGKRENEDEKTYYFIYEKFVKAFFTFFTIGSRTFIQHDEKNYKSKKIIEIIESKDEDIKARIFTKTIDIINRFIADFIYYLRYKKYPNNIVIYTCDEVQKVNNFKANNFKVNNSFDCSFKLYEHYYEAGNERNFKKYENDEDEERVLLTKYDEYDLDRDKLRSLGRKKRNRNGQNGQNIKFKFKNYYKNCEDNVEEVNNTADINNMKGIVQNYLSIDPNPELSVSDKKNPQSQDSQ